MVVGYCAFAFLFASLIIASLEAPTWRVFALRAKVFLGLPRLDHPTSLGRGEGVRGFAVFRSFSAPLNEVSPR